MLLSLDFFFRPEGQILNPVFLPLRICQRF